MNIALYYTHCDSLGHTSRVKNLLNYFENDDKLILQGGKSQEFSLSNTKIVNLPNPNFGKHSFNLIKKIHNDIAQVKERVNDIINNLKKFNPDIFVTELFPFGRENNIPELLTTLKYIKNNMPNVKIYASIGYPIISVKVNKLFEIIDYYDKIFIHCPKELDFEEIKLNLKNDNFEDPHIKYEEYSKIFEQIKEKVMFTGYVFQNKIVNNTKSDFILISRGAGAVHPKIITTAIKTAKLMPNEKFKIVYGPSSSEKEEKIFLSLSKNVDNVELIKSTNNMQGLIKNCKLSVSMSGYNTSIETLFHQTKNILIPRVKIEGYHSIEQMYRALLMKKITNSTILDYRTLTPEILAESIRSKENEVNNIQINHMWFNGGEITKNFIESHLKL